MGALEQAHSSSDVTHNLVASKVNQFEALITFWEMPNVSGGGIVLQVNSTTDLVMLKTELVKDLSISRQRRRNTEINVYSIVLSLSDDGKIEAVFKQNKKLSI